MKYRPEIDGLRALAVLGVLFYHLEWTVVRGGWLGVDIFFVISGYLISSVLLSELQAKGKVSISHFYLRRIRRIAPALLVCLTGSFFLVLPLTGTEAFSQYLKSAVAALFSVSNIFFWQHSGYFALDAKFVPLLHTWTLGIEEQFYIIIPAVFAVLSRCAVRRRRWVWLVFGLMTAISYVFCRYGRGLVSPEFLFYMLPSRMWELALGTMTALLLVKHPRIGETTLAGNILSSAGALFLIFALALYTGSTFFAEKALFVCIGTVLFIICAREGTLAHKFFAITPVRFIGKISYSLYLWHWPVIVFWNILVFKCSIQKTFLFDFGIILVSTGLATLSWKYIEQPFRRKENWVSCLQRMSPYVVSSAALVMVGFFFFPAPANQAILDLSLYPESSYNDMTKGKYPALGEGDTPMFMVVGDSHARALAYAFDAFAEQYGVSGVLGTHGSTAPIPTTKKENPYAELWLQYINERKVQHVVLVGNWRGYLDYRKLGNRSAWATQDFAIAFRRTVKKLIRTGHHVWIVEDVPRFRRNPVFAVRLITEGYRETVDRRRQYAISSLFRDFSSPRLHILDPWPALVQDEVIRAVRDGYLLYRDGNHLTPQGAQLVKNVFTPLFETIIGSEKKRS
ncbi:acyltransferase family protein [Desulfovibrio sp. Fe33]|uniref:acyltransferase family protein n=1 Tax=Desulfovibrio sp. Fe33 TaxID=3020842 RepID=UPI00234DD35B|nr:acyltransferase family protein [Desulfovibrio sp. Fe33]